jgi:MHS family proline/betaine transporter-like MFS transporter
VVSGTAALCLLVVPLYAMGSQGSSVALVFADVVVGAVLGMLVISAHLSER